MDDMSLLGRLVCENLLAQGCMPAHKHHDCELFLPTGARRQGALAPQLPRNTRSSAFQPEDLLIFTDYECFTGCFILCLQVMTIVSIVSLLTPHFFPFILRGVGGVFSGCLALFRARENEATQKQYFKTKKVKIQKKNFQKNQNRQNTPPCPWDTHYQFSIKTLLSHVWSVFRSVYGCLGSCDAFSCAAIAGGARWVACNGPVQFCGSYVVHRMYTIR